MLVYVGLGLALVAIYQVVQAIKPLVDGGSLSASEWERVDDETEALLSRRDRLISELRELEFEAALSKVDPQDLPGLRDAFELEALEVTRRLDTEKARFAERIDADVNARLGQAKKAQATAATAGRQAPSSDDTADVAPEDPATQTANTCSSCAEKLDADARFCDACGTPTAPACAACGVANRPDAKFCKGCGATT